MRGCQLLDIGIGDLASDATGCYVDVCSGKENKQRQVSIAQDVCELVAAYLAATNPAVQPGQIDMVLSALPSSFWNRL